MPPLRTLNAQGRQKSCSECAKAKRKCKVGQPRCARCSIQNRSCVYPRQSTAPQTPKALPGPESSKDLHQSTAAVSDVLDASTTTVPDLGIFDGPIPLEGQLLDFDLPEHTVSTDTLSHFVGGSYGCEDRITPCNSYSPVTPSSLAWTNIGPFAWSRTEYVIHHLTLAPKMMVETTSTLWCHAHMYDAQMPKHLQDAFATCALYNARNEVNADYVMKHIISQTEKLLATSLLRESSDVMGRAHALMLYQIMLIFGNDVRSYSLAVDLIPHLEQSGHMLLDLANQQVDAIDQLPLYPSTFARAAWRSFIYRETLRRTVLSLFQLVAICQLMCGQQNTCVPSLSEGNKVILSVHLWRAKNAFDFAVAWNERKHFLVHELDFTEVFRDAQPDDIDDFAKAMLVGLYGLDDVKAWFYTKGSIL